jgi:hypothetical protein
MAIDKKILEELNRYNSINKYITEQEVADPAADAGMDAAPDAGLDMGADVEMDAEEIAEPVDVATDPDVEKVYDEGNVESEDMGGDTEELDITDLVTKQNQISDKQDEYMESMFEKLADLESKLSQMDQIFSKINDIEAKVEKYRQKSPEEKLQLRSLDSYPYNQKLTDFFMDKEMDMEKTGKNEYVLTSDEVENYSASDIKKSFNTPFQDEE